MRKIKQAVIFAGGKGTRMGEQSKVIPKPLSILYDKPIIIQIMRVLAKHGITEFVLLTGHLKDCFDEYFSVHSNKVEHINENVQRYQLAITGLDNCTATLVFTGENEGTAERLLLAKNLLDENFVLTYGDSYGDIDIENVESVFLLNNSILTITGIIYTERFGLVCINPNGTFKEFREKEKYTNQFINGGYMCVNKKIFDFYYNKPVDFMKDVMARKELKTDISVYIHNGYWKAIDTLEDLKQANEDYRRIYEIHS